LPADIHVQRVWACNVAFQPATSMASVGIAHTPPSLQRTRFHARHHCARRRYEYVLPLWALYASKPWHDLGAGRDSRLSTALAALQEALTMYVGRNSFHNFCKAHEVGHGAVRSIQYLATNIRKPCRTQCMPALLAMQVGTDTRVREITRCDVARLLTPTCLLPDHRADITARPWDPGTLPVQVSSVPRYHTVQQVHSFGCLCCVLKMNCASACCPGPHSRVLLGVLRAGCGG
jgi:hypothetical protein